MNSHTKPAAGSFLRCLKTSLFVGCLGLAPMALANELTNGGFESGLTGWTTTLTSFNAGVGTGSPAQSGSNGFYGFDNTGYGSLAQSFATVIGQSYDVSFWAGNYDLGANSLSWEIQGVTSPVWVAAAVWPGFNHHTGSFVATSLLSTIDFRFNTVSGTGILTLDDVSVEAGSPVPEGGASTVLLGSVLLGFAALRRRAVRA